MKKTIFIIFMFLSANAYGSAIDLSAIYNSGFDSGVRCVIKELKSYVKSEMTEEEFFLRLEQCRHECRQEHMDGLTKEQIELMMEGQ